MRSEGWGTGLPGNNALHGRACGPDERAVGRHEQPLVGIDDEAVGELDSVGRHALLLAAPRGPGVRGLDVGPRAGGVRTLGFMVIAETAITLVLVAGAGLMIQNFLRLRSQPLGFDAARDLRVRMNDGRRMNHACNTVAS